MPLEIKPLLLGFRVPFAVSSASSSTAVPVVVPERRSKGRRRKRGGGGGSTEAEDLVKYVLRRSDECRDPLVAVLNKHVRSLRTEHCFLLFDELGKRDAWLQCLEVFRWMQQQRWYIADNGIYSKLISVMGKKGQTRMAMWLFSQMRNAGCRPDTSVYNALITAHLHSRDKVKALAKARGYLEKMKGMERCRPNVVTYNILLRAFALAGDVKQVDALFKEIDGDGAVVPDVYTYNGIMDAYGKNGMIKEVESVLVRMKSNRVKPDVITFNILIDSYGRCQEFDKMKQVFLSLMRSREKPTLPTFNSMIANYGKARMREEAEGVYQKMVEVGYKPSQSTHECLIKMYGCCDCLSKARQVFDEAVNVQKGAVQTSTLNAMLAAYCANGLLGEADKLLEWAVREYGGAAATMSTYKLLYRAYAKWGRKEMISGLVKRMQEQGIVPSKKFFLDALQDFAAGEDEANPSPS